MEVLIKQWNRLNLIFPKMTLDCIKSSTDDPIQPQTQLGQYDR